MYNPNAAEPDAEQMDAIEDTLVSGIRAYMDKYGFMHCHLGLSGGIDSALVAYLAVKAAGAENIVCFSMPSRFSSQDSVCDAATLASALGCRLEKIPIETIFASYLVALEGIFEGKPFDIAEENLQARIRGTLLMAYANKFKSLLLATGNKSEIAMGYCTLYGDTAGGLAPIAGLFKTEVYALCNRINSREAAKGRTKIIPQAIIDKPPSAELRPNQKDEDSLPPYNLLDKILSMYLDKNAGAEEIAETGIDAKLIASVIKTVKWASFKQQQMPPALRLPRSLDGVQQ